MIVCRSVFVAINLRHPPFMRESASRSDHAAMSLPGTNATCRDVVAMSAFGWPTSAVDRNPSGDPIASTSASSRRVSCCLTGR